MTPTRRGFLRALAMALPATVAGAELDLERLLWVPKAMVTVPGLPAAGLLITPAWVRMCAEQLARDIDHRAAIHAWSEWFPPQQYAAGDTLVIRKPQRYVVDGFCG